MKKTYQGNIKPHIELDRMGLRINFGEQFELEEWQTGHPQFLFALKNGWVLSPDRKSVSLNTREKSVSRAPYKNAKDAVKSDAPQAATRVLQNGVNPAVVHELLEHQSLIMKGIAESMSNVPRNSNDGEILKELAAQQRMLLEMLQRKELDKVPQQPDMMALLHEIKESLAHQRGTGSYNKSEAAHSDGFKVVEVETEKFVSKIEDMNVKSGNIVTQQHSTGGVEDALAALKKLKGK